jgi:hypothetical protein
MKGPYLTLILLTTLCLYLSACDKEPETYDDCILQSMKGVQSDRAARAIEASCSEKTIHKRIADMELPDEAVRQLDGRGAANDNVFRATIYNGNSNWLLTQLTIRVPLDELAEGENRAIPRKYIVNTNIKPLTVDTIAVAVTGSDSNNSWGIVGARGIKVE